MEEQWNSSSSSSSIDGNCNPSPSTESSSFAQTKRRDFSTELTLGLSLSPSSSHHTQPYSRDDESDWPPIKPCLRSFFVKVYMEGVPIGRKLDLLMHDSYQSLIKALRIMFPTAIIWGVHEGPDDATQLEPSTKAYVLTYEDKEGDWMMVGDVSWEFFLTTVRKLKITRVDKC